MEELLRVGVISSTHGLKGEVKVFPTTDDVNRFKDLGSVILDTGKEKMYLEIEHVKFFKKFAILKFKQYDHINDIEQYKGKDLLVERKDVAELKEGEFFITDMIGMKVILDDGEHFGELKDVLVTGANDVYVVASEKHGEVLLPAIKSCIIDVDIEKGIMTVRLMKGLI